MLVVLFLICGGPEVPAERIHFGHQSVGRDILDGVSKLMDVRAIDGDFSKPAIYEQTLGENEKPFGKVLAFSAAMDLYAEKVDVAMFKFCYIDFNRDTDVPALFKAYAEAMDKQAAAHPGTTFVHITTPLTVVQHGAKAWLRHLIGQKAWGEAENVKRHEYNQLLRARYAGKAPIFDLADLESHRDNGKLESYVVDEANIPMMYGYYTRDGGHLSDAGKEKMGNALHQFVRSLPKRR